MTDHADRAVKTAIGMRRALAAFNRAETVDHRPTLRAETYRALDGAQDLRARVLTGVQIKGKREPVSVYALAD